MSTGQIRPPPFNEEDAHRAQEEWGANCGPGAAAAIVRMTLDGIRPHFAAVDFEKKRYTNFPMMKAALTSIGIQWRKSFPEWPSYGLCRIQWEGPWTSPKAPPQLRLRHTHWIGAATTPDGNQAAFDINCINNGSGWVRRKDWEDLVVPWILQERDDRRATGTWHITHTLEVSINGDCK